MALQYRRVTGNPAARAAYQNALLQAKIRRLPQSLAAKQQKELIQRDTAFQNKQIALAKKQAAQRKREQQAMMGLEAGKLGLGIAMSPMADKTLGDIGTSTKNIFSKVTGGGVSTPTPATPTPAAPPKTPGIISSIPIGSAVASGLTGFGIGKLLGDKKKSKKAMYGAGAGALLGMLSSPKGSGFLGGITGGLFGGLGGLL